MPDRTGFVEDTEPFRRELLAHCYRMLGSFQDAEDLVQETYLRAWRSYGGFEGRSSVRTWLYQIATNGCLSELARRSRRMLPSGLGDPEEDPGAYPEHAGPSVSWLQPAPDAMVNGQPAAAAYTRDERGTYQPYGICVLTVTSAGIRRVRSFGEPGLVALFGFGPHP